jgi:tRNA uridine 5-carbamoylmethylation protein Kti12
MSECIILRGIPGSGKSFISQTYKEKNYTICSADDFFQKGDLYKFNIKQLGIAHKVCREKFTTCIENNKDVVVDNTNLNESDIAEYLKIILSLDKTYSISIIEVTTNELSEAIKYRTDNESGKNIPEERMNEMYSKFLIKDYKTNLKERFSELNISFSSIG